MRRLFTFVALLAMLPLLLASHRPNSPDRGAPDQRRPEHVFIDYEESKRAGRTYTVHADPEPPEDHSLLHLFGSSEPEPEPAQAVDCYTSGKRIMVLYGATTGNDKLSTAKPYIKDKVAKAEEIFELNGANARWRVNSDCSLYVKRVWLGDTSVSWSEIKNASWNAGCDTTFKCVVFVEGRYSVSSSTSGVGGIYDDDRPDPTVNYNNTKRQTSAIFADPGTYRWSYYTVAHEIIHMMGGVQKTAPNHHNYYHCDDDYDRMCYGSGTTVVCSTTTEKHFDCRGNDYWNWSPASSNYLSNHWNVTKSYWLAKR